MSRGNAKPNNNYFECFMKQNELVTNPCYQMSLLRINNYDLKIFSTSFHNIVLLKSNKISKILNILNISQMIFLSFNSYIRHFVSPGQKNKINAFM